MCAFLNLAPDFAIPWYSLANNAINLFGKETKIRNKKNNTYKVASLSVSVM